MKTACRNLCFAVLTAALLAPGAIHIFAAAQDDQRHEDQDKKQKRIYDSKHKDYHDWNDNEDRAYHQYFQEQHKDYRDYSKLNRHDQEQYWNWRHQHPDDQDRH